MWAPDVHKKPAHLAAAQFALASGVMAAFALLLYTVGTEAPAVRWLSLSLSLCARAVVVDVHCRNHRLTFAHVGNASYRPSGHTLTTASSRN